MDFLSSNVQDSPFDYYSRIFEPFTDFAFTFVGIYRCDFLDAGKKKITAIFRARRWKNTVSDKLIHNVLFLASIAIALCSGLLGLVVEEFDGYSFTNFGQPMSTAFL